MTTSQANAVRKAESYLAFTAFSRKGLIKQLQYEKFSTADATYAVDHITVDWNEQADKKAESYMSFSAFSRDGLIKQLEYEGFTPAQAAHGAKSVGL
ncbi:Ltp family lipoprotein [Pseudonocardia dioxanivorans]|uniref:Ltp family lipoprotein n=1 Tax=Pseudonocardia dioxanivorans TaxID=240495 RepID=UPI000CD2630C|nr:Ltp family lipoprotein [Pseudonocardia dioxanivorans]